MSNGDQQPGRSWYNFVGHCRELLATSDGRTRLRLYASLIIGTAGLIGVYDRTFVTPDELTPVSARGGWDAEIAKATGPEIAASLPAFAVRDEQGNIVSSKGSYAELWSYNKIANNGKYLLLPPQQTGDCASFADTHAFLFLHGKKIVDAKSDEPLKLGFPPASYGIGRYQVAKRKFGNQPGCTVGYILQGGQGYGIYPWEQAEKDGYRYGKQLADNWGWTGPPKNVLDACRKTRLRAFAAVRTWDDLVDALANGYPVPFGAPMVFRRDTRTEDGKRWLQFDSSVSPRNRGHAQCLIGVDDRPGRKKGCFCMGSWGVDAHDAPLNGEPRGGGWVSKELIEQYILTSWDAYAVSDIDEFESDGQTPLRDDEWNAFPVRKIDHQEVAQQLAAVDQPEVQPVLEKGRKMLPVQFAYGLVCLALALLVSFLMRKYGTPRGQLLGTLLLCFGMIYGASTAEAGRRHRMQYQSQSACSCPNGVCANGQCAANGCANGQCETAQCVNGQCATGYVRPADKPRNPYAGLSPDQIPGTAVASTEKIPAAVFNAFGPAVHEPVPNVWTAFPMTKALRTYKDCYEHETDFLLVVGKESAALMELEASAKPVAFEAVHPEIKPGKYHVWQHNGHPVYESLGKLPSRAVGVISVRKQQ